MMSTCVAHGEELFRVLAVALAAERLGHGEAQLEAAVVVGFDLAVSALSARGGVGRVLVLLRVLFGMDGAARTYLVVLDGHQ